MKKQQKRVPRKQTTQRRRTKRRVGNGVGKLIARGVKSLVSTIPVVGSFLGDISDFTFKAFGISNESITLNSSLKDVVVRNVSLCARFNITAAAILAGSRTSLAVDMGKAILSQYSDGRVISLTVRIIPSSILSKRSGDWHLGFQPFFNNDDENRGGIKDADWMPTEQGIHRTFLSATGPANKPLVVTYKPVTHDGRAFVFNPLDSAYGQVSIRYDNYDRSSYTEFSPEDFSCDTIISGIIETRVSSSMPSTEYGAYKYSKFVLDKMKPNSMWLMNPKQYMAKVEVESCKNDTGYCKVTGKVTEFKTLDGKANSAVERDFEVLSMNESE